MQPVKSDSLPMIAGTEQHHVPGMYTLLWWHPQALSPAECRSCSGGVQEPVQLIMDIFDAGCNILGLTYESPERVREYQRGIGIEYPIITVDRETALAHGVAKVDGEPWPSIPHRMAFLVDEHGQIINRYKVHDPVVFLRNVRDDVKAGPPPVKWESPKKGFFARLLGR